MSSCSGPNRDLKAQLASALGEVLALRNDTIPNLQQAFTTDKAGLAAELDRQRIEANNLRAALQATVDALKWIQREEHEANLSKYDCPSSGLSNAIEDADVALALAAAEGVVPQ